MAKIILQDYETPNPDLLSCGRPEGVWIMRLRYSWQKKKKWSTYVILILIRNVAFNIYQLNGYPTKYSLPSSVWTLKLHAWFVCSWKIWICQSVLVSPLIKKIPQHSFTNHWSPPPRDITRRGRRGSRCWFNFFLRKQTVGPQDEWVLHATTV